MVEVQIIGSPGSHGRLWIRFNHSKSLSSHHHEDYFTLSRKEQDAMLSFLRTMERYADRSSKAKALKNKPKLQYINAKANRKLRVSGKRIFDLMKRGILTVQVETFEDLFEKNEPLTLVLNKETRVFPWELAYDGKKFLFEYTLGRKIQDPPTASFEAGVDPQYRKALVIGLNYREHKLKEKNGKPMKVNVLDFASREALSVCKFLKEKKYNVVLLRNNEATAENARRILSNGVSIFHFTGHGMFGSLKPRSDEESALLLYDGILNQKDLRKCFEAAQGAPYLSFLNACLSAKETCSRRLTDAFVDCGAEYVIGTLWPVYDPPATNIARRFYKLAINNEPLAKSLLLARKHSMKRKSMEEITTWPSFIFYGSPAHKLPQAP